MEKVSVIIPVYNGEEYLSECIDSVVLQDYSNLEIIIINDGSTDKTESICNEYQKREQRIKVINNTNHGVSYSRNQALDIATGKYIVFIDADDYVKKDYISKLYNNIKENNSQCSICLNYSDEIECTNEVITQKINRDLIYLLFTLFGGFTTNKMYLKKIIVQGQIRFNENIHMEEDMVFNIDYFKNITDVTFTNEKLYYYRKHSNSAFNDISNTKWFSVIDTFEYLFKKIPQHDKKCMNIVRYNYYMILIEAKYRIKYIQNKEIKRKVLNLYKKEIKLKNIMELDRKIKIIVFAFFPRVSMIYKRRKVR